MSEDELAEKGTVVHVEPGKSIELSPSGLVGASTHTGATRRLGAANAALCAATGRHGWQLVPTALSVVCGKGVLRAVLPVILIGFNTLTIAEGQPC